MTQFAQLKPGDIFEFQAEPGWIFKKLEDKHTVQCIKAPNTNTKYLGLSLNKIYTIPNVSEIVTIYENYDPSN